MIQLGSEHWMVHFLLLPGNLSQLVTSDPTHANLLDINVLDTLAVLVMFDIQCNGGNIDE